MGIKAVVSYCGILAGIVLTANVSHAHADMDMERLIKKANREHEVSLRKIEQFERKIEGLRAKLAKMDPSHPNFIPAEQAIQSLEGSTRSPRLSGPYRLLQFADGTVQLGIDLDRPDIVERGIEYYARARYSLNSVNGLGAYFKYASGLVGN